MVLFKNFRKLVGNSWILLYEVDGCKSYVIGVKPQNHFDNTYDNYRVMKVMDLHNDLVAIEVKDIGQII